MTNHKGTTCIHRSSLCQEGICSSCHLAERVHCGKCGWTGVVGKLALVRSNIGEMDELGCPSCLDYRYIED